MHLTPTDKLNQFTRYSDKYKDVLKRIADKEQADKLPTTPKPLFFYRIKSIGVGAHSVVYIVQDEATKAVYAQKCIAKEKVLSNK